MTKTELVNAIQSRLEGLTKVQVKAFLDAQKEVAIESLKSEKGVFLLPDVVKIVVAKTPAKGERKGRNPATGATITVKAKPAGVKVKARFPKFIKVEVGQLTASPKAPKAPKAPRQPRPQAAKVTKTAAAPAA